MMNFLASSVPAMGTFMGVRKWSRTDGVAGDTKCCEFQSQSSRELHDRTFAGCVWRAIGQADQPQSTGHVDDATVLCRFHVGSHGFTTQPGSIYIRSLHLLKLLVRKVFDAAPNVNAGAVNKHVDPAMVSDHLRHHSLDFGLYGHIAAHTNGRHTEAFSDFSRGRLGLVGIATYQNHRCAGGRQSSRHGCSQTLGAASHDSNLVLHVKQINAGQGLKIGSGHFGVSVELQEVEIRYSGFCISLSRNASG